MSFLASKKIMDIPFIESVISFYNAQVIPQLSKKNKAMAISTAVALSMYLFVDKVFRPPKNLRHIPYQSFFSFFKNAVNRKPFDYKIKNVDRSFINAPGNNGIYMTFDRFTWAVHIANPIDAKYILMKYDKFPKGNVMKGAEKTLGGKFVGGQNIATLNGSHWKSQRKTANPAFHRSMPVKLFGRLTIDLFKVIDSSGDVVDFADLMERWTLDAIGNAGFNFDFQAIKNKNNEWVETYNSINKGMQDPFYFLLPIFDTSLLWLSPKRKALHEKLDRFSNMMDQIIIKKRQDIKNNTNQNAVLEENEKDLLTLLIEGEAKGDGVMTNQELKSNLVVFFIAGHDTTAKALSCAIYYLAKYPEYQQKAREEAISILGDQPDNIIPTVEQTRAMSYINQTLRMNGPAVRVIPRVSTEDETLSDGTFIPKGSTIIVDIYNIHHLNQIWKNNDEFNPDRFDENGEASQRSNEGFSWIPFGNGPRQCIGMNFSLSEQRVLLSMLLRKYTWTLSENSEHKDKLVNKGISVIGPTTMDIKFQKRY